MAKYAKVKNNSNSNRSPRVHLIVAAIDSEGIVGNISGPKVASVPLGKSVCHLTPLFLQESGQPKRGGRAKWERRGVKMSRE